MKSKLMLLSSVILFTWAVIMLIQIFFSEPNEYNLFWPMVIMPIICACILIFTEFFIQEDRNQKDKNNK